MKKKFSLAVCLSIATPRFVCDDIGQVYEILNWMTGDNLYTHQLPRAARWAVPIIASRHPDLAAAATVESMARLDEELAKSQPKEAVKAWIAWAKETAGLADEYEIESASESWTPRDPIVELSEMIK